MYAILAALMLLPGWGRYPDAKVDGNIGVWEEADDTEPLMLPTGHPPGDAYYLPAIYPPDVDLTDYDIKLLARLAVVECRGMGDRVEGCTRSVVSTVLYRMEFFEVTHGAYGLSDGTVYGTLDHHYQDLWQFPPWVTRGCEFVNEAACLDWVDLVPFVAYVRGYLEDGQAPCADFLYYDSIPGGNSECVISIGAQWVEFHSGWGWEPKIENPPGG